MNSIWILIGISWGVLYDLMVTSWAIFFHKGVSSNMAGIFGGSDGKIIYQWGIVQSNIPLKP